MISGSKPKRSERIGKKIIPPAIATLPLGAGHEVLLDEVRLGSQNFHGYAYQVLRGLAWLSAVLPVAAVTTFSLLRPPLHKDGYADGFGTVYSARYRPAEGAVTYHWPDADSWHLSFDSFTEETRTVRLGRPRPAPARRT